MAKNCIGDFEFDDMPRTRGEWRELTVRFTRHSIEAAALEASEADKILPEIILKLRKLWAVNFTKQNSLHEPPRVQKRGKNDARGGRCEL